VTMDFLPTVMEVLGVSRPEGQAQWGFDGQSVMPILRGEEWPQRGVGWMYRTPDASPSNGYGYRFGKWKLSVGGISCNQTDCRQPQLYDLEADVGEHTDLSSRYPEVLAQIQANFSIWYASVHNSIANESRCSPAPPSPSPSPLPPSPPPSRACDFLAHTALGGANIASGHVASKEECCGACMMHAGCAASDFVEATPMRPSWDGETAGGTCNLKRGYQPKEKIQGEAQTACHPPEGALGPSRGEQ